MAGWSVGPPSSLGLGSNTQYEKNLDSGWVGLTIIDCRLALHRMARRRGRTNYKQIKTGTVNLGQTGAQVHIASVRMIDEALRGSFLNNVQFSVMSDELIVLNSSQEVAAIPAYTLYLSTEDSSAGWSDDAVIAVSSTPAGGGNGNLTCKRTIKTDAVSVQSARDIGPVHVWMESTDVSSDGDTKARVTLTAWGRMILLVEDF